MALRCWIGAPPKRCDICMMPKPKVFIEGKTKKGTWALMCLICHPKYGVGEGLGKGQRYNLKDNADTA